MKAKQKSSAEEKLTELGIVLPDSIFPGGHYALASRACNLLFTAGQTPKIDGRLRYTGKLGDSVSDEDGYDAAKLCVINCLAIISNMLGGLDKVEQIVKVNGYVNCTSDYQKHSVIMNGATDLLAEIFPETFSLPARSAIGVNSLPGNATCEVELIVSVRCSEQ